MSPGEFSEQPLPPGERRCSQCGHTTTSAAGVCWLCCEKLEQEGSSPPSFPPSERRGTDNVGWALFGVIAIFLCLGLSIEAPGVLAILVVLTVPALVRTLMVGPGTTVEGSIEKVGWPATIVGVFLSSLGITAFVGTAAAIAFFAVCLTVGFGAFAATNSLGGVACGFIAGGIAGLIVFVLLIRQLWARKG